MVELRKLEAKDAPLMLEWMHDDDLVKDMRADFKSKTLADCQSFIQVSQADRENVHFAVADSDDAYMGTVSLKNIDRKNRVAEFAICMRRCTLGNGMAAEAMKKILDKAFQEMGLKMVYWSVNPESKRAVRFYDKNGYMRIKEMDDFCRRLILTGGGTKHLPWNTIGGIWRRKPIRGKLWKTTEYRCKISPETINEKIV